MGLQNTMIADSRRKSWDWRDQKWFGSSGPPRVMQSARSRASIARCSPAACEGATAAAGKRERTTVTAPSQHRHGTVTRTGMTPSANHNLSTVEHNTTRVHICVYGCGWRWVAVGWKGGLGVNPERASEVTAASASLVGGLRPCCPRGGGCGCRLGQRGGAGTNASVLETRLPEKVGTLSTSASLQSSG